MEKWKRIKEAPRLEVSNRGRVRWIAIRIGGADLFKVIRAPQIANNGSLYIPNRGPDGRQVSLYVHRLVARYFLPKPKGGRDGLRVGWKDGDKTKNTPANLYWY